VREKEKKKDAFNIFHNLGKKGLYPQLVEISMKFKDKLLTCFPIEKIRLTTKNSGREKKIFLLPPREETSNPIAMPKGGERLHDSLKLQSVGGGAAEKEGKKKELV